MLRAIQRYLNALFFGFIVTILVYLFWVLDQGEIWRGIAFGVAGAAVALGLYIFVDRKFGTEPELYDKNGNLVDRSGRAIQRR
jgi:hypothetical protein